MTDTPKPAAWLFNGPGGAEELHWHHCGEVVEGWTETPLYRADQVAEVVERMEAALRWYGEQARLARLIHSEGDAGRHALQDDGGKRARAALKGEKP
jgi:hypothetical protein